MNLSFVSGIALHQIIFYLLNLGRCKLCTQTLHCVSVLRARRTERLVVLLDKDGERVRRLWGLWHHSTAGGLAGCR